MPQMGLTMALAQHDAMARLFSCKAIAVQSKRLCRLTTTQAVIDLALGRLKSLSKPNDSVFEMDGQLCFAAELIQVD